MAGSEDENDNDRSPVEGAAAANQTVNKNHKEPKIFNIRPDNDLFKYAEDLIGVIKTQATRKSNITKVSNMIKVTIWRWKTTVSKGLDPQGSRIKSMMSTRR